MRYFIIIVTAICSCLISVNSQDFAWTTKADSLQIINSVRYLENDTQSNVWIGYEIWSDASTLVPKVAKWDGNQLKIFSNEDGLDFGVVRAMAPSADGGVWLATANGIRKTYDDGSFQDYPLPQLGEGFRVINKGDVSNMVETSTGSLFCSVTVYTDRDLYNSKPERLSNKPEVWMLKSGEWTQLDKLNNDDIINYSLYKHDGNLVVKYKDLSISGLSETLGTYNEATNSFDNIRVEDFLDGQIDVQVNSFASDTDQYLLSFKPEDIGFLYEGFSLFNTSDEKWKHYGTSAYVENFPDKDFSPIPSAIYEENGKYLPYTNFAQIITPAKNKGFWMSMAYDYKEEWVVQKGGGLLYFDGDETFIRYSSDTHEGIRPMRFNINHKHNSDGVDPTLTTWRFGTGVAYDKSGNLLVGSLIGGLWFVPKSQLPDPNTSVEDATDEGKAFVIVPNVVTLGDPLNLSLSDSFKGSVSSVYISDVTGKIVSTYSNDQLMTARRLTVKTDNFTQGIYYVNIVVDGVNTTQKVVLR